MPFNFNGHWAFDCRTFRGPNDHSTAVASAADDLSIVFCHELHEESAKFGQRLLTRWGRYWLDLSAADAPLASGVAGKDPRRRHEQLVTDTEATVRRMLNFCELAWEPACITFQHRSRRPHAEQMGRCGSPFIRNPLAGGARYRASTCARCLTPAAGDFPRGPLERNGLLR